MPLTGRAQHYVIVISVEYTQHRLRRPTTEIESESDENRIFILRYFR